MSAPERPMTTQAKHSPGPWYVIEGGNFIDVSTHPDSESNHRSNGWTVCELSVRWPFKIVDKDHANARLIALAPEMADALQHARDTLDRCAEEWGDGGPLAKDIKIAGKRLTGLLAKLDGEK